MIEISISARINQTKRAFGFRLLQSQYVFTLFTCKYILTLKKAKAESALSLIYSCTVNGLIPYIYSARLYY